jgi:hypothetical protein
MLGPSSQFKEACELRKSPTDELYELCLEDDWSALMVVLLALHCRSEMVPVSLSFDNLLRLAIVCDKYDCAGGVAPWARAWTEGWSSIALDPGHEEWLFIAWVFRIPEGFEELSRKIILESYVDTTDGELRSAAGQVLERLSIPQSVFG